MIREPTQNSFNEWHSLAELIFAQLEHTCPDLAGFLGHIFLIRDCKELFKTFGENQLDPLVPGYYVLVNHWGKLLGTTFEVIADESKVLAKQRGLLLALADQNLRAVNVGYDRRRVDFPLKASDLIAADSTAYRQVQFADIISGAIACAAKARVKGELKQGTFAHDVFEICFSKRIIIDGIWPCAEIDPVALGTDVNSGNDEFDIATYMEMVLNCHPSTRKN